MGTWALPIARGWAARFSVAGAGGLMLSGQPRLVRGSSAKVCRSEAGENAGLQPVELVGRDVPICKQVTKPLKFIYYGSNLA